MTPPSPHAQIVHAECLPYLRSLPDASVDAVVTDPPYGLSNTDPKHVTEAVTRWTTGDREFVPSGRGFMNEEWDSFVPPPAVWDECLRVLRPGGHLVAFAGSRTIDLMTLSIRLAGFDIRDSLVWVYGSGMPHGQDVSKALAKKGDATGAEQWQGWNTALKPAQEPIVLARKPLASGTAAQNLLDHGTGALNIDATRIAHRSAADLAESTNKNQHADYGTPAGGNSVYGDFSMVASKNYQGAAGRHPANVLMTHSADCDDSEGQVQCAEGCPVAELDAQSGGTGDIGGASRFFLTTAADPFEGLPRFFYSAKAKTKERPTYTEEDGKKVQHISVKPLAVMRWLVRMVTPPGGLVLDPFAGSGTTAEAALLEGFDAVAIERHGPYVPLIEQRIARIGGQA